MNEKKKNRGKKRVERKREREERRAEIQPRSMRFIFQLDCTSPSPSQPSLCHYGARGNEVATRRFQGSRTGVRLIPPVTSSGEEGMRCRETGSTTWGSEVEGGGSWWQEEVEPSGGEERERETRERRAEGGMNVRQGARGGSQERLEGGFALVSRVENVSLG